MSTDISSNDICYGPDGSVSQELLCPACEKFCDYIPLNSTCLYSKVFLNFYLIVSLHGFFPNFNKEIREKIFDGNIFYINFS